MKYLYSLITLLLIAPSLLVAQTQYTPAYTSGFGGATYSNNTYTFPTGAEVWAGFSNENADIYPLSFSDAGSITFTASTAAADGSTNIKFRFEKKPHPDVDPSYNTDEVTVTGTSSSFTITIPSQGANTFRSALLYVVDRDETVTITDIVITADDPIPSSIVPPSAGAPAAPARAATDVISLFSDTYTTVSNLAFDQGWCGAGAVSTVTLDDSSQVVRYNGLDCQGMGFDAVDASSFTKVHFDLYLDESVDPVGKVFNLKYVNGGGVEVVQTVALAADIAKGEWVSFDLDLPAEVAAYTTLQQFAVVCNIQGETIWYDNLYLHKETTLSSSNIDVIGLKLYPNPAVDLVNIAAAESIDQVLVFDLMGRLVKDATPGSNDFRLDVSHLNKGVYMVQLKAGDKVATTKLIK